MTVLAPDHIFSPSQLDMFNDCTQAWEYAYVRGLKKKGSKRFFDLGNYFHELAHVYYQLLAEGRKPGDSFVQDYMRSRMKSDLRKITKENVEIMALVHKMMEAYVAKQSPRIDKGIQVLGVELHLEVPFTTIKGRTVFLQGYLDLLYRDAAGKLRLRDHKTGGKNSWSNRQLELLPQLLMYMLMVELAMELQVLDVEISWINSYDYKKKVPTIEEQFGLFRHSHLPKSLENFKVYLGTLLDKLIDEDTIRKLSKDCGNCQYQQICSLEMRGADPRHIISQQFEKVERDYGKPVSITANPELTTDSGDDPKGNETTEKSNSFVLRWDGPRIGG